jgi:multidrug efflux pump subunit AcrA (membrane-fusion protein)
MEEDPLLTRFLTRSRWLVLFVGAGFLVFSGCGKDGGEHPQAAEETDSVVPVAVSRATARDITTYMTFTGKIQAIKDITLRSKVAGVLEKVLFEDGDGVERDQALAQVEDEEYLLALREADASLFSAESNLAKMEQFSRPQEIDAAQADYERALADFGMAQLTWQRRKQLYEKGVISKHEYDIAEMEYKGKKAARNAAKKQLDLTKEGARTEDIEMARFQVKRAEAQLALAKKRLDDTRIRSQFRGIIARRMVDPGDLVSVGTPIANVLDMTRVEAEVGVTEKELPFLRMECEVVARVVAYPERTFQGRIVFIGVKAEGATGTFPTKIEFDNLSARLRPGMVVEVKMEKETHPGVIAVRQDAVLDKVNRNIVFVIQDGRSQERPVKLGSFIGEDVVVTEGLTEGELFVVVGQQSLKDGSRVRIEREE